MDTKRLVPRYRGKNIIATCEEGRYATLLFHMHNHDQLPDAEGTELVDVEAAREHATTVARELIFKTSGMLGQDWSKWSMVVHDCNDVELFFIRYV